MIDTRPFFRPVSSALVPLLRGLPPDDWHRRTLAGTWVVRDIVAHLVDLSFRRVSFHRDRLVPPPPPFPIAGERDLVRFINGLNHDWVAVTRRFSPLVLTELFELASRDLADFFEQAPLDGPGLFGVSWAGEAASSAWFDIGREFTELWHHQMQIRLAVGAPPLDDPKYLGAVIALSVRALPHAYREIPAREGESIEVNITGPSGGVWTLRRGATAWTLESGADISAAARVRLSDDAAWRLFYNALDADEARSAITIDGRAELARPFFSVRSIII